MEFEYSDVFYVSENDLREMFLLCRDKGYSPQLALNEVAGGWDDADFYSVGKVEDQIIEEIERRLKQSKKEINSMDKYDTYYMNPSLLNAIEIFLFKFGIAYTINEDKNLLAIDTSSIKDDDTKLTYERLIKIQFEDDFEYTNEDD